MVETVPSSGVFAPIACLARKTTAAVGIGTHHGKMLAIMSVAIMPGEHALILSSGFSRASSIVYELSRAFERPYTPIEFPRPCASKSLAPLGYDSTSVTKLLICSHVILASVKKARRSAEHLLTQPDAAPDDICTMRPLCGSSRGRNASSTRFGPRTLTFRMSATVPAAMPALLTMLCSGGGLLPNFASRVVAAAVTLLSDDVSISSTVNRSFHSGF
mmetsp:Transcript_67870/g.189487  ORF Transcript_67870/g.189487 Transcript_67870/m.189487 type:complete len:217 (+) Transcript_67870:205-855(+)